MASENIPAAIATRPASRQGRRQMQSQRPPAATSAKPAIGKASTGLTAPGQDETVSATAITPLTPPAMGMSAR